MVQSGVLEERAANGRAWGSLRRYELAGKNKGAPFPQSRIVHPARYAAASCSPPSTETLLTGT